VKRALISPTSWTVPKSQLKQPKAEIAILPFTVQYPKSTLADLDSLLHPNIRQQRVGDYEFG
jgi:hypothetical protein